MDDSIERARKRLYEANHRPLTPAEEAAQASLTKWNIGYAKRPIILSDGQPARQDPNFAARNKDTVRAHGFKGKGAEEGNPLHDPEFVKLAKSAGMSPEDALKFTKLFRPPEK